MHADLTLSFAPSQMQQPLRVLLWYRSSRCVTALVIREA